MITREEYLQQSGAQFLKVFKTKSQCRSLLTSRSEDLTKNVLAITRHPR
jgi:hypothetical protein